MLKPGPETVRLTVFEVAETPPEAVADAMFGMMVFAATPDFTSARKDTKPFFGAEMLPRFQVIVEPAAKPPL